MSKAKSCYLRPQLPRCTKISSSVSIALLSLLATANVQAFEITTDNPDIKARWDNTVKYSASWRMEDPSSSLNAAGTGAGGANNQDDANNNFDKGLISSRFDILSEFDLSYQSNLGLRMSAAAWYDNVYQNSNDNNSTTANQVGPTNRFPNPTVKQAGGNVELLDAFVYSKFDLGTMTARVNVGRHAILYGESLFFGDNGIAGGMAPVDANKGASVPGTQFKELMRPVEQISGQVQINPNLTLGAYYQFKWYKTELPPAGSYFASLDVLGAGSERYMLTATPPGFGFTRTADIRAKNSGQGGMQLRYRPEGGDVDYGLYAIKYHEKLPQVYIRPLGIIGFLAPPAGFGNPLASPVGLDDYVHVYHEAVKSYGASFSTTVGDANVAGEVSVRRDTSLTTAGTFDMTGTGNNRGNALYPIGNTAHAQVSSIYLLPPTALWHGGSVLGEIAWNRTTSVTSGAPDANTTRDAWAWRGIFMPGWNQVIGGLDLEMPIGIGYNAHGRSSAVRGFNRAYCEHCGDVSVGLNGTYLNKYKFTLNYTTYFGDENPALNPNTGVMTFDQYMKDKDFLSFSVSTTF